MNFESELNSESCLRDFCIPFRGLYYGAPGYKIIFFLFCLSSRSTICQHRLFSVFEDRSEVVIVTRHGCWYVRWFLKEESNAKTREMVVGICLYLEREKKRDEESQKGVEIQKTKIRKIIPSFSLFL